MLISIERWCLPRKSWFDLSLPNITVSAPLKEMKNYYAAIHISTLYAACMYVCMYVCVYRIIRSLYTVHISINGRCFQKMVICAQSGKYIRYKQYIHTRTHSHTHKHIHTQTHIHTHIHTYTYIHVTFGDNLHQSINRIANHHRHSLTLRRKRNSQQNLHTYIHTYTLERLTVHWTPIFNTADDFVIRYYFCTFN